MTQETVPEAILEKGLKNEGISFEDALTLTSLSGPGCLDLFSLANRARERTFGNRIEICSIINAKSGNCTEDCAYCAQSSKHGSVIQTYDLVGSEETLKLASRMDRNGSTRFGIVTSGRNVLEGNDFEDLLTTIEKVDMGTGLEVCASLGFITKEQAKDLKKAGLTRLHHNLETSRSFFPSVCTSHGYEEKLETLKNIKEAGLKVCTGGIVGMGESWRQRVELAFEIKEAGVDSVPINSLVPIKGTRVEKLDSIRPLDFLKVVSIFRLVMPEKSISVAAGREQNLRDLQSMIFFAGANGMMIGDYLTLKGRKVEDDLQMVKDLGLEFELRQH